MRYPEISQRTECKALTLCYLDLLMPKGRSFKICLYKLLSLDEQFGFANCQIFY
jgi:hypothetical protein